MNWGIFDQDIFKEDLEDAVSPLKTPTLVCKVFDDPSIVSRIFSYVEELKIDLSQVCRSFRNSFKSVKDAKKSILRMPVKEKSLFFKMSKSFSHLQYQYSRTDKNKIFVEILSPPCDLKFCDCLSPLFFDNPLQDVKSGKVSGMRNDFLKRCEKIVMIINVGGAFTGLVAEFGKITKHKTFSRYVIRKKQGKRQISHDKGKKSMSSVGSQMRRNNEILFAQQVNIQMNEWKEDVSDAGIVLLHTPGPYNKRLLFEAEIDPNYDMKKKRKRPKGQNVEVILAQNDPRVISIPFQVNKVNFTELKKLFEKIFRYTLYLKRLK